MIKQSPPLTLNLLRIVNSVAVSPREPVTTLNRAIAVLGRRQLQRWVQLLLFVTPSGTGDLPSPLLQLAATRGKLMELLTHARAPHDAEQQDRAFMIGVMSLLPVLLGLPMQEILASLPHDESLSSALLAHEGRLGSLLALVETLDTSAEETIRARLAHHPELSIATVSRAQTQALGWANSIGIPA
jgi:c-di-GMP-related signal transduction protein